MISSIKSVEIVEINYRLPNFLNLVSDCKKYTSFSHTSRQVFFFGGNVLSADPQVLLPVQLATFLTTAHLSFRVADGSTIPSCCTIRGKFLDLKVLSCENKLTDEEWPKPIDFYSSTVTLFQSDKIKLFAESNAEKFSNKEDKSLNIYFKMKIKLKFLEPNTDSSITGDLTELSYDFSSILKDLKSADIDIKVSLGGGQPFQCHRLVLAARSPIFRAMFESDVKETNEKVVHVDDILPKAMEHFISFLYCGRFQDSSWIQSIPQLTYASDKYCVKSIHRICDTNIILCVTKGNALALGKFAERHGLKKAAVKIREFIAGNAKDLTLDTEVDTIISDNINFEVKYCVP